MKTWYKNILQECNTVDTHLYTRLQESFFRLRGDAEVPEVSIVLIAYNEEKRILPAIMSLAAQKTALPTEVIVVNNNSTDNTQSIIDQCGVLSVFQPLQGPGHARQAGLEKARGKFVVCADADTLYPPDYVSVMIQKLSQNDTVAVYAPCGFIADGEKSALSLAVYEIFRDLAQKMRFVKQPELCVGGATLAMCRESALKYGFRTDIKRGEDGALIYCMKADGKIKLVLDRKARVKTSSRTLDSDGGMLQMIVTRLKRECQRFPEYFVSQKGTRKDNDENLLKKQ